MPTLQALISEKPTLATVTTEQEQYKEQNGAYKQYKLGELAPDIFVHEFGGPDGLGYQVYEYKTEKGKNYVRSTAVNAGRREEWRNFDWVEIVPD